jgi:hypothetical protein
MVSPAAQRTVQCPCWQTCDELQEIPQPPQLLLSVMTSVQLVPQARRSDGQTGDCSRVGLGIAVSGTVVVTSGGPDGTIVGSGEGVSTTTYEVTSGVATVTVVAAGDSAGIPVMPGFVSKNNIASMTITPMPATMRLFIRRPGSRCEPPGAGTGVVTPDGWSGAGANGVPHAVQNLVSGVFWFPHLGQIFDMNTPADASFLFSLLYKKPGSLHAAAIHGQSQKKVVLPW